MRGRPTLLATNPKLVRAMQIMRMVNGLTLMEIAAATGISLPTVAKYTRHIPCERRHGSHLIFDPKAGIVGRHFIPRLKVAAGRKA